MHHRYTQRSSAPPGGGGGGGPPKHSRTQHSPTVSRDLAGTHSNLGCVKLLSAAIYSLQRCISPWVNMQRRKVSLQVGVAFEDGIQELVSFVVRGNTIRQCAFL